MVRWLLFLIFFPTFCSGKNTVVIFDIRNSRHDEIWIPKLGIESVGVHKDPFFDVTIGSREDKTIETWENSELTQFTGSHPIDPNARFRYLKFRMCLKQPGDYCYDTAYVEFMTMYWNHAQADWSNHSTCMISSTKRMDEGMKLQTTAMSCEDTFGQQNETIVQINIHEWGLDKAIENNFQVLSRPVVKRQAVTTLYIDIQNTRYHHITVRGIAAHLIDMGDFKKTWKIEKKQSKRLTATYTGGAVDSEMYFYINDLDGGMHHTWGVAKVSIFWFEIQGSEYRQCALSAGATKYRMDQGKAKDIEWSASVQSCGDHASGSDIFHVTVD